MINQNTRGGVGAQPSGGETTTKAPDRGLMRASSPGAAAQPCPSAVARVRAPAPHQTQFTTGPESLSEAALRSGPPHNRGRLGTFLREAAVLIGIALLMAAAFLAPDIDIFGGFR